MRQLTDIEVSMVSGGNGGNNSSARDAALRNCRNLPDDTKVTFEISIESNVSGKVSGIGGEATTTQTVTIETTCGDLRKAESGKG